MNPEELQAELQSLRQEEQLIKVQLERLTVQINRLESLLAAYNGQARKTVSPCALNAQAEHTEVKIKCPGQNKETNYGDAYDARPVIEKTAKSTVSPLKRFYRPLNIVFPLEKLAIVLIVCFIVCGVSLVGVFDRLEVIFSNVRYAFKGQTLPSDKIALVVMDTISVQELGPFGKNWRQYHGQVLKNLADDGALAVGFDVVFPSPSEYDQIFIDGINYARNKNVSVVVSSQYDEFSKTFSPTTGSIMNTVSAIGHTYLRKDTMTNLVRWAPLQLEETLKEGAVQVRRTLLSLAAQLIILQGIEIPDIRKENNNLMIHFHSKGSYFKTYSYAAVYKKAFTPGIFKGKLVLIGSTLPAHRDFFDVPTRSQMPGVEVHAHALRTLLTGNIRKMTSIEIGIAIFISVTTAAVIFTLGAPLLRRIVLPILLALYWAASVYCFSRKPPVELNLVYPTISLILTWSVFSFQEKLAAKKAFRKTVGLPEKAIRKLESDPDFQEGTARKLLTILESDIVNYSVFSSQNQPGHVRSIIAEYNSAIEKVIYDYGGYVNKYIGDAVLAIFGYPMSESDSARRAVNAAQKMKEALKELAQKWRRENKKCFESIRIGINRGYVSISYLGKSKKQLDVLGDNVDLTARLEAEAAKYGGIALISLSMYEELKHRVVARKVSVNLKNRPDVKEAYVLEKIVE